jgi:hypothetical protein
VERLAMGAAMTCYWHSDEGCDCKQPERAQQGKLHTKVVWDEAADLERLWPKLEDMVDCLQDRITPASGRLLHAKPVWTKPVATFTLDVVLPLREDVAEALSEPESGSAVCGVGKAQETAQAQPAMCGLCLRNDGLHLLPRGGTVRVCCPDAAVVHQEDGGLWWACESCGTICRVGADGHESPET